MVLLVFIKIKLERKKERKRTLAVIGLDITGLHASPVCWYDPSF
jgi:hypothetical protein